MNKIKVLSDPIDGLDVYLVGGAVRDELLGLKVNDRDWLIIGTSQKEMLKRGFKPISKDFCIFLHPDTGEEYALARLEQKISKGYHGFLFTSNTAISLKQDLKRRDFTINAIAKSLNGEIIDFYGGIRDLKQRRIRHISKAFVEDPVRVIRAARFAARYKKQGFQIDFETTTLMKKIVNEGEVDSLTGERVWYETQRALKEEQCEVFFQELRRCGALVRIMPEIDCLFSMSHFSIHYPTINLGLHTLLALKAARQLTDDTVILFAVLVHALGGVTSQENVKASSLTCNEQIPSIQIIYQMCNRMNVPKRYRFLALKVVRYHHLYHKINNLEPSDIVNLLEKLDCFRNPQIISQFIICCIADKRGYIECDQADYEQANYFKECYRVSKIDTSTILTQFKSGEKIREVIRQKRLNAIKKLKHRHQC